VEQTLPELPPKPFVMGETVIGASWPDVAALEKARAGATPSDGGGHTLRWRGPGTEQSFRSDDPWWFPKGLPQCAEFEARTLERYGQEVLDRFRRGGDERNLQTRKFESEVLRTFPGCAGWVMNQIRDVPQARLGFMDDLGRWRFSPEKLRAWLDDQVILLRTPDHRRSFTGGREIACEVGVSNFGSGPFEGTVEVRIGALGAERVIQCTTVNAREGDVGWSPLKLPLPAIDPEGPPAPVNVRALAAGLPPNGWDMWAFPEVGDIPEGVVRLDGLPFTKKDQELDFEERCYSSGWGLKVRSWKPVLPHPETVLFKAPLWRFDAPLPRDTRVIVTHKLTRSVLEFLVGGGRVLLLASKTAGGIGTRFVTLWGQVPLVIEEEPLRRGDAAWVEDLLHHDLTRRYTRAIPSEDLGLADQVDPIVRLVFTHDSGAPKLMDSAFVARAGKGLLLATGLDHTEDAGRFLMQRFVEFLADETSTTRTEFDPVLLLKLIVDPAR
jgi:hypothetical protein